MSNIDRQQWVAAVRQLEALRLEVRGQRVGGADARRDSRATWVAGLGLSDMGARQPHGYASMRAGRLRRPGPTPRQHHIRDTEAVALTMSYSQATVVVCEFTISDRLKRGALFGFEVARDNGSLRCAFGLWLAAASRSSGRGRFILR